MDTAYMHARGMPRRIKRFIIDADLALGLLRGHSLSELDSDLPLDAHIFDVHYDWLNNRLILLLVSESFEEVEEATVVPVLEITYATREYGDLLDFLDKIR